MIKKYPSLRRNNGFGRIKYYLENPVKIEPDKEIVYRKIYNATIGFLKKMNNEYLEDLEFIYNDVKSISELIYNMYGYSRLTNYVLHKFNNERIAYYQEKKFKVPDLETLFK